MTINDKSLNGVLGTQTQAAGWKAQINPLSYLASVKDIVWKEIISLRSRAVCFAAKIDQISYAHLEINFKCTKVTCFFKFRPIPPSFSFYFHSFLFLISISIIQIEKSIDGVLGIQTQGGRMVGIKHDTVWKATKLKKLVLLLR